MGQNLGDLIREVVAEPLAAAGVDLEDVEVRTAGRRRLVRVTIDTDRGISLDEVAEATRMVSARLDELDVMGERSYVLEVGSPGVARPLTQPRHWRRNIGRLVRIATADDEEPVVARIVSADDSGATVLRDEEQIRVEYPSVRRAVVQVELNRSEG